MADGLQHAEQRNAAFVRVASVALAGVVLAVALGAVALQRADRARSARAAFPVAAGRLPLAGLEAPVDVLRDADGIPHIEALRASDAWRAVGFVQAQDRLAQMLWLRRLAQGRTAEIIGEAGLSSDRLARTIDFSGLAERQLEDTPPETRAVLDAYAEGVNARLERVRTGLAEPPLLVDAARESYEPWRPEHSLAIFKLISWGMGNQLDTNLVLDDLIESLGGVLARPFKPTGLGVRGVEVPPTNLDALGRGAPRPPASAPNGDALGRGITISGGNAWVLAGRRTRAGAPILVADLQLPPTLPSLVHVVHARGGALDVAGVMVPGVPVLWIGRNLHVAWAMTPGRAVTVDLYRESLRPKNGLYQNGTRWVALGEREERIEVATPDGRSREEVLVVQSTRHGPLINGLIDSNAEPPQDTGSNGEPTPRASSGGARDPLALAWTGMRKGDGVSSLLAIAKAASSEELLAALETHHEPVMGVVYADTEGRGGMQLAGWLPYRPLPSGFVPVPGRTRVYDWRVPIDHLALPAQRLGGDDGKGPDWVISSDNPLDDDLAGGRIEWLWRTDEQGRVLRDELRRLLARADSQGQRVDLRAAAAVQTSVGLGGQRVLLPALDRLARRGGPLPPEAEEMLVILGEWDGARTRDSRGAIVHHMLLEHLVVELFEEAFGPDLLRRYLALPAARPLAVVKSIVITADRLETPGGWSDVDRVSRAVRESLRKTFVSLSHRLGPARSAWTWGALHRLRLRAFADRWPGASALPGWPAALAVGGDGSSPSVTRPDLLADFAVDEASSFRIAIDLAAPDRMLSSQSPGQSEHPLHPHFTDGLRSWSEGRPRVLLTSRLLIEEESSNRLILDPAP